MPLSGSLCVPHRAAQNNSSRDCLFLCISANRLGQIPLVQGIRESGDAGEPVALSSRPDGEAFVLLAGKLAEAVREG